jgi:hypothetical protein
VHPSTGRNVPDDPSESAAGGASTASTGVANLNGFAAAAKCPAVHDR